MAKTKKVHWTQTPEGRKRLSEQSKRSHAGGKRKTAPKTAPKAAKKVVQSFPLDIFPPKGPAKARKGPAKALSQDDRVALALALVNAVQDILTK